MINESSGLHQYFKSGLDCVLDRRPLARAIQTMRNPMKRGGWLD